MGVVERVISEEDFTAAYAQIKDLLAGILPELIATPTDELLEARYQRFRRF